MFKEHIRSDDEVLTNSKQVLVSTDSYEALATHTKHKKNVLDLWLSESEKLAKFTKLTAKAAVEGWLPILLCE